MPNGNCLMSDMFGLILIWYMGFGFVFSMRKFVSLAVKYSWSVDLNSYIKVFFSGRATLVESYFFSMFHVGPVFVMVSYVGHIFRIDGWYSRSRGPTFSYEYGLAFFLLSFFMMYCYVALYNSEWIKVKRKSLGLEAEEKSKSPVLELFCLVLVLLALFANVELHLGLFGLKIFL